LIFEEEAYIDSYFVKFAFENEVALKHEVRHATVEVRVHSKAYFNDELGIFFLECGLTQGMEHVAPRTVLQ